VGIKGLDRVYTRRKAKEGNREKKARIKKATVTEKPTGSEIPLLIFR